MVGNNSTLKDHYAELQNIAVPKSGFVYIYCSNESPVNVFFDNLQVVHTRGPILEETHYYPFGLIMGGISFKSAGSVENKKKYNSYELNSDLGLNLNESFYRLHDPQLGKFWQIDPKTENQEYQSPYSAMGDNPILKNDLLGDREGDYYNELGQHIGNDGINDSKVYVIKTTKTANDLYGAGYPDRIPVKTITCEAATQTETKIKEGIFDASVKRNVIEIQPAFKMEKMLTAVSRDDGTGGTSPANNREYSGNFSRTGVRENRPGPVNDPTRGTPAVSNGNPEYHSHPSGTKPMSGNRRAEWMQPPSLQDVNTSGTKPQYVIGMKDETIYIYNRTGVLATIPAGTFQSPLSLPQPQQ